MDTKTLDELALLVVAGDETAHSELWVRIIPAVRKTVATYARNSKWVDSKRDDIEQGILLAYPVFIKRYDPAKQTNKSYDFSNWLFHTLSNVARDVMRREKDVLGVGIPQKADYPEWFHLGAVNDCPEIVNQGRENMQRGHLPCLGDDDRRLGPKYKHREHDINYNGVQAEND